LENNGVLKGHCECVRGLKTCGHMAALLLYARANISCTDVSCAWRRASAPGDDEVRPLSALYPPNKRDYVCCTTPLQPAFWREVAAKIESFDEKYAGSAAGVKFILEPEEERFDRDGIVANALSIIRSNDYEEAPCKMTFLLEKFSVTREEILRVEEATRGQLSVPLWSTIREGRITASKFGKVLCAMSRQKPSESLLRSILETAGKMPFRAVQWGVDNERVAIREFCASNGKEVIPSGLWLHECGFLGGSPDGLVVGEDAIIEVKCPYQWRNDDLKEALRIDDLNVLSTKYNTLKKNTYIAVYHDDDWYLNEKP